MEADPPPARRKGRRVRWLEEHKVLLRAVRALHHTPSAEECSSIAVMCGMSARNVQVWFQNARQRGMMIEFDDCMNAIEYLIDHTSNDDSNVGLSE